jgi:hypothetical protein
MKKGRTGGLFPWLAVAAAQWPTTRTNSSTLFE